MNELQLVDMLSPEMMELAAPDQLAKLLRDWDSHRPKSATCPGCQADMTKVGLIYIAYTFEKCDCELANFTHIYEQMWHRPCFVGGPDCS